MRVIDVFLCFFGKRSEIIVKGLSNITRVTNSNINSKIVTRTERVPGTSDQRLIKVIIFFIFFIPFQVFFILLQLSSKYLVKYLCLLCLIRVDNKFLWFLYFLRSSSFYHDLSF